MAGDWIKMRTSLLTSPKVNGMARILEQDVGVTRALSTGFNGRMNEIVTRNVMRNVTVGALLTVWGAANEHTSDGVFKNTDLNDIDDMAGIPGFGNAMSAVAWAIYNENDNSVILPNFSEYNTCGGDRQAEKNRERQRRYRERKKENSNDNRNVTNDVTHNAREEKRREEIKEKINKKKIAPQFVKPTVDQVREYTDSRKVKIEPQRFVDFYESNGWKVGKNPMKDWKATVRTWEARQKDEKTNQSGIGNQFPTRKKENLSDYL